MFKLKRASSVAVAALATFTTLSFTSSALAAETYVGAALSAYTRSSLPCPVNASCERSGATSGKIYTGYMFDALPYNGFNITHGIEAMEYQIGTSKTAYGYKNGHIPGYAETAGVALLYKLEVSFNNDFSVMSRLGTSYAHNSIQYSDGDVNANTSWFGPVVGLGAKYALTKNLSLVADWDRLPVKYNGGPKAANNMFSIGVSYKF